MYETSRFLKVKRFTDYFEMNPSKMNKTGQTQPQNIDLFLILVRIKYIQVRQ